MIISILSSDLSQVKQLFQVLEDSGNTSEIITNAKRACQDTINRANKEALGPLSQSELEHIHDTLLDFVLTKQPEDLFEYGNGKRQSHEGGWFVNGTWNWRNGTQPLALVAKHQGEEYFDRYLNTAPSLINNQLQRLKRRADVKQIKNDC